VPSRRCGGREIAADDRLRLPDVLQRRVQVVDLGLLVGDDVLQRARSRAQ
jgi:hypothetical protein